MARAMSLGLARPLAIATPLRDLHKEDVIRIGVDLRVPLELTLSCMDPAGPLSQDHCGRCSKCRERQDAFKAAGVPDPTAYAVKRS